MINFYILAFLGLIFSFVKDKDKTKKALKKSWKSFESIMPQFLSIILLIGIILAILTPEEISKILGNKSGIFGIFIGAIIGSITLIPGFVAFPLSSALLHNGAGIAQIAAFVSTLMMVGIVTIPIEIQYFGKKATIIRNLSAFIFSFIVAFIIGGILQ
ncbi:MAG: hypothetical protein MR673_01155 [Fusobacterium perfoetens]|uniref:hypothetical protein n=1 Tax=Fusobacterium perfoetens TaxID=852 RepID=UPI0023F209B3|nr:hypothetical protein [Fusobacterium perfoetens]MCI6151719.1 hypothetical protein [Fusobacterium perfoetens]MDY3237835.1 hypothetical protein [Fusobacterium perfoetens]